jgi:hypothetical protein
LINTDYLLAGTDGSSHSLRSPLADLPSTLPRPFFSSLRCGKDLKSSNISTIARAMTSF